MNSTAAKWHSLRVYSAAAAISSALAIWMLRLWKADLHVPFDYVGDALFHAFVVKSVIEHRWIWSNPDVGAPFGLELYDFPVAAHDSVHLLLIKALSLLSKDWALVLNLYFLLGFPLITISSLAVLRHFGVRTAPAGVAAVLYSFLPSRLLKGEGHLFLDVFFQVPLAVLILLWVCGEEPPLVVHHRADRPFPGIATRRGRWLCSLLICALLASSSAYYAFFAACLMVGAGVWASFERRRMDNAVAGAALSGAIGIGLVANLLPSIVYHARHGSHQVAQRFAWEAETYGMKIAALLLPTEGHRIGVLRELKRHYEMGAPLVGENATTSLGFVGAVGFLALVGIVLTGRRSATASGASDDLLRPLAVLNLLAVLLGTIGGFGSLVALLVTAQIRSYARLNVFIAFFSLFAAALLLDRLGRRRPVLGGAPLLLVLAVGLCDQVTPPAVRPYASNKDRFADDDEMVRRIEERVAPHAAVFQLPYMSFPEAPPMYRMSSYDGLIPYLHSRQVRWSFPALRNGVGDVFVKDVSQRDPSTMVETLAAAGFGGILIDRNGYDDRGSAIEAAIRQVLGADPLVSRDARLAFFGLAEYGSRMPFPPSQEQLERLLFPIEFIFDGCYGIEHGFGGSFRWCKPHGQIRMINRTSARRKVALRMSLVAAQPPAHLRFESEVGSDDIELASNIPYSRVLDVAPGVHTIQFACDGKRADAPEDPRSMIWRIENFAFEELRPSSAP